jgi:hypothetical protein
MGVAYGQLGLQNEASDYFTSVSHDAAGTQFAEQTLQLQSALDVTTPQTLIQYE